MQHDRPLHSAGSLIVHPLVHDAQRAPVFPGEVAPSGVLKKLIPKTAQKPGNSLHKHPVIGYGRRRRCNENSYLIANYL
jgi:hypothetical protein